MPKLQLCLFVALVAGLAACIDRQVSSSGTVFAGPMELPLHQDIKPKSQVVARVHHGDKLDVIQQRRRLYKLRTRSGIEGWTDERNLMSVEQMDALGRLEKQVRRQPGQGVATSFEQLNVHTEPQRFAPSFLQIEAGEKFDVIAHRISARTEPEHRVLVKPQPKVPGSGKKHSERKRVPPPPPPDAPKPPDDWVELSQERTPPPSGKSEHADTKSEGSDEKEPAPVDDWTLVRTAKGAAGWVLTSRIYLSIPDEVAQYAEGHRITTYFSLGKIRDNELNADKDIWLWTTVHAGQHPFDFDSFRVFTWNPKRHRYETAYIQRTVEGYLPVLVKREAAQETFSVCFADRNNPLMRKRYILIDRQVRGADAQPCTGESMGTASPEPASTSPSPSPENSGKKSLTETLKQKATDVKKRFTGK